MNAGGFFLLGSLFLTLAALVAICGPRNWREYARYISAAGYLLLCISSLLLAWHYLGSNRTYVEVNMHYPAGLSWPLRLASLWSGSAGSLLLFALINGLVVLYLLLRNNQSRQASIMALALQAFLLLVVMLESPFACYAGPIPDARPVNLLLTNIWMVIHPPLLFTGHVLLLLTMIESLSGKNRSRLRVAALSGLAIEGAGMFSGGLWAYQVLGWGGFWGWDPVENSSLVPWLFAAALVLLQSSYAEKNAGRTRAEMLAGLAAGVSVLFSICATRGGLFSAISVHAFSPGLAGNAFGVLALGFTGYGLWQVSRVPKFGSPDQSLRNILLRQAALAVVLLALLVAGGSVLPPLLGLLQGRVIGAGRSWFETIWPPCTAVLLSALLGATWCGLKNRWRYVHLAGGGLVFVLTLAILLLMLQFAVLPALVCALSLVIIIDSILLLIVQHKADDWQIAGLLLAIFLTGAIVSEQTRVQADLLLEKDEPVRVFDSEFVFTGMQWGAQSRLTFRDAQGDAMSIPWFLPAEGDMHTEPVVRTGLAADLYMVPILYFAAEHDPARQNWLPGIPERSKEAVVLAVTLKPLMSLVRAGAAGLVLWCGCCAFMLVMRRKRR